MNRLNLIGQKFTRLLVTEFAGISRDGRTVWRCICDCGKVKNVQSNNLKSGTTKSCGCLIRELTSKRSIIHGHKKHQNGSREYKSWRGMMSRCYNERDQGFRRYGGRGIKVCTRWHTFENFLEDMGLCPDGLSLDRRENNGHYILHNCRWATQEQQANNRCSNKPITYMGTTQNVSQWARKLGIRPGTLWHRLYTYNWSIKKALTSSVRRKYGSIK